MPALPRHSWLQPFAFTSALIAGSVIAPSAWAGEVKFGSEPLETDDNGNITQTGRSATTEELKSLPGEEIWPLHVWAKIDKGAPGPLYVEFYGTVPGSKKRYRAWAYEHGGYDGESFVSLSMELEGKVGFNRGRTYGVEVVQVSDKGKNIKLASGKLSLVYVEADPESDESDPDDELDENAAQDELDSFVGGDDDVEGPPPVESPAKKRGCSVDPRVGAAPGTLLLLLLGAGFTRRRRR